MSNHTIEAYGRIVELRIAPSMDEFGQFHIELFVDGKSRFSGHFTDRSEDLSAHGLVSEEACR